MLKKISYEKDINGDYIYPFSNIEFHLDIMLDSNFLNIKNIVLAIFSVADVDMSLYKYCKIIKAEKNWYILKFYKYDDTSFDDIKINFDILYLDKKNDDFYYFETIQECNVLKRKYKLEEIYENI